LPKRTTLCSRRSFCRSESVLSPVREIVSLRIAVGDRGANWLPRIGGFSSYLKRNGIPFVPAPERERRRNKRRRRYKRPSRDRPEPAWTLPRTEAMTPPMRKMKLESLPQLPKRGQCPKRGGEDILCYAQRAWAKGPRRGIKDIPEWYSGLHGVPYRFLRKSSKDSTSKEKALGLIVRMNHMLDYPYLYGMDTRRSFFCLPARRVRVACRSLGPLYERDPGGGFTPSYAMNTSYASSNNYDWKRTLVCTVRNFVHFVAVMRDYDFSTWWNSALSENCQPLE
jgi:hypothetical protein